MAKGAEASTEKVVRDIRRGAGLPPRLAASGVLRSLLPLARPRRGDRAEAFLQLLDALAELGLALELLGPRQSQLGRHQLEPAQWVFGVEVV